MGDGNCAKCCTLISGLGVVLLVLFGVMFSRGAVTFQVISIMHGWDPQQKAQACFSGALIYAVTLFISIVSRKYNVPSKTVDS